MKVDLVLVRGGILDLRIDDRWTAAQILLIVIRRVVIVVIARIRGVRTPIVRIVSAVIQISSVRRYHRFQIRFCTVEDLHRRCQGRADVFVLRLFRKYCKIKKTKCFYCFAFEFMDKCAIINLDTV